MISILSILALASMFTGCSESGSVTSNASGGDTSTSTSTSTTETSTNGEVASGDEVITTENGDVLAATLPKTPFNLSSQLGTPPGVPN